MIALPRGVVLAERTGSSRWLIHAEHTTRHVLHSGTPTNTLEAAQLAAHLAEDFGGVTVRCVVLITDLGGDAGSVLVSAYPRLVYAITPSLAIAHAVPPSTSSFLQITEGDPLTASVFTRRHGRLFEHPIRHATFARLAETVSGLGLDHIILSSSATMSTRVSTFLSTLPGRSTIQVLPSQAHLIGAAQYAIELNDRDGVWLDARGSSRLITRRPISYTIHRPSRSVFDPDEIVLAEVVGGRPVLLAIDSNVHDIYGDVIREYARRRLNARGTVLVSPHDADKSLHQVERVCEKALAVGLDRRGIIVAIGGGVTLDLCGLAAALFRRGIGYVRVATTLLGQVDVSVGIKQAVNACGHKNLLGAFYPPIACINDYDLLRSLPSREVAYGLAEVVKIALVRDAHLFDDIEQHGAQLVRQPASCSSTVARDIWYRAECLMLEELSVNLYESSLARLVDFGHTFSPAIETNSQYRVPHGAAVALDMLLSTGIAVRQGLCDASLFARLARLLSALQLPTWSAELLPAERLWSGLESSRLHRGGALNLVVPVSPGRATVVQAVTAEGLAYGVAAMREHAIEQEFSVSQVGAA